MNDRSTCSPGCQHLDGTLATAHTHATWADPMTLYTEAVIDTDTHKRLHVRIDDPTLGRAVMKWKRGDRVTIAGHWHPHQPKDVRVFVAHHIHRHPTPTRPKPPAPGPSKASRPRPPRQPTTTRPTWHEHAACRGLDTSLFFPIGNENAQAALDVCATCPVNAQCRAAAMRRNETHGIWGGTTPRRRRTLRRATR